MTKSEAYIAGRGLYQYDTDVFAEMMTRTCADLRAVIAGVHDGDPELTKGMSALRKPELAAMCAEWETGKRENERDLYADTPARFNPDVIDDVHAVALTENDRRTAGQTPVTTAAEEPSMYRGKPRITASEVAEMFVKATPDPEPVTFRLYDRVLNSAMTVLGSSALGIFYQYDGSSQVRTALASQLHPRYCGDRYVALCAHDYTQRDSCPNCDADEEQEAEAPLRACKPGRDLGPAAPLTLAEYLTKVGTHSLRQAARDNRC